ncbi:MAG: CBS domain-containing protein [Methyloligellaceae bacterium]
MDNPLSAVVAKKDGAIESAAPGDLVSDAVEKMHTKGVGALPVVEGDRLVGIFTERDALYRVIHGKLAPASTPVSEVMTKDPDYVAPDMSVIDAMRMINEKRFRHLPLVEDGKLVGLVSSGDLTRWVVDEQKAEIDSLGQNMRSLASKNKALIALVGVFAVLIVVGILTT